MRGLTPEEIVINAELADERRYRWRIRLLFFGIFLLGLAIGLTPYFWRK